MSGTAAAIRPPRFSIVSAVYDVEAYLPAFIRSVERLRIRPEELEVVAVDDGSRDRSLDLLRAWSMRSRFSVKVFTKPNGGQASARNLGLDRATGEWVTFPDPDDVLDREYLHAAAAFVAAHPAVEAMSARPVILDEAAGRLSDRHPRRWQYHRRSRMADLADEPNVFFGVAAGSFFRGDRIAALGLRFDARIRPNFEDGHFAARFLLGMRRPQIGLVADAVYLYRKRASGTSTTQRSMADPGRFSVVPELGYLDLIDRARAPDGSVPEWIQQLLVYELSWYLSEDEKITATVRIPPEVEPRFHELLDRILRELDPAVVARHAVRPLKPVWSDLFAHVGRGERWHSPAIVDSRRDTAMCLRRLQYRFVGAQPGERFRQGNRDIAPAFAKTMAHRYLGRDLLWERIVWLPAAGDIEAELEGAPIPIVAGASGGERLGRRGREPVPGWLWIDRHAPGHVARAARRAVRRLRSKLARWVLLRIARATPIRRRYAEAWVLMDRIHDADDNGERLFEHLRAQRPDINAWFVLQRGSPDWKRLAARHGGRLIAHGSWSWKLLLLNAAWLASSHADLAVIRPPRVARIEPEPSWKIAFLQHGVIKDDLSRWLNERELDVFVTSTGPERRSIADDGTPYRFGSKEVVETGLPRFDRLLAKARETPIAGMDLVLVAPTWRSWLSRPLATGSQRRDVDEAIWDSDYLRSWLALLASEKVAKAVDARGWRLGFMPHPNLQQILGRLDLPPNVEALPFEGTDVQGLYARCALLITDYSSVVFNTAYLDRPAVYFQFDRDEMLRGAHIGRGGYFDYERDGFGPVVDDVAAAEAAIVAAIRYGPRPEPEYQARIDATFPVREGGACARVIAAMELRSRPWAGPA